MRTGVGSSASPRASTGSGTFGCSTVSPPRTGAAPDGRHPTEKPLAPAATATNAAATSAAPEPASTGEVVIPLAGGAAGTLKPAVRTALGLSLALGGMWTATITAEGGWGEPGAWPTILLVTLLPLPGLAIHAAVIRRRQAGELRLTAERIEVAYGPRQLAVHWAQVAEVAVRPVRAPNGWASRFHGLQVRLYPDATAPPGARTQPDGWLLLCTTGASPRLPAELDRALARFAGARWEFLRV
jgi:hypothetical protein